MMLNPILRSSDLLLRQAFALPITRFPQAGCLQNTRFKKRKDKSEVMTLKGVTLKRPHLQSSVTSPWRYLSKDTCFSDVSVVYNTEYNE